MEVIAGVAGGRDCVRRWCGRREQAGREWRRSEWGESTRGGKGWGGRGARRRLIVSPPCHPYAHHEPSPHPRTHEPRGHLTAAAAVPIRSAQTRTAEGEAKVTISAARARSSSVSDQVAGTVVYVSILRMLTPRAPSPASSVSLAIADAGYSTW